MRKNPWFCYQLIAKPSNKTAAVSWPDPYIFNEFYLGTHDIPPCVPFFNQLKWTNLIYITIPSNKYHKSTNKWLLSVKFTAVANCILHPEPYRHLNELSNRATPQYPILYNIWLKISVEVKTPTSDSPNYERQLQLDYSAVFNKNENWSLGYLIVS